MAKQKLRKTSKSGEFNVFPGQSTDNPLPRYSLAPLRRQSNTLYLIASSLGQYRILPLLRHANRGDTNCSQKAMPTRGSSWVLCISARLEPPNVYYPATAKRPASPPPQETKGPQRPNENGEAVANRVLRLNPTHYS